MTVMKSCIIPAKLAFLFSILSKSWGGKKGILVGRRSLSFMTLSYLPPDAYSVCAELRYEEHAVVGFPDPWITEAKKPREDCVVAPLTVVGRS